MAEEQHNIWPKRITVDKRIVKILSQSTYDSFPNAVKEIIMNSYDADASEVRLNVDTQNELITIDDNGKGMSETEFGFFLRIAGRKREKGTKTAAGRYIVGQFGVGFLASFPFFKNYEIETTKKGSEKVVYASIPSYKYFSDDKIIDVGDIKIQGYVKSEPSKKGLQHTKVKLSGFTVLAKEFFNPEHLEGARRYSIVGFDGIKKLEWRLSEELPVEYDDERFNCLANAYSPNLSFKVFFNDKQLKRKTFGQTILEVNGKELTFENLSYKDEEIEVDENKFMQFGNIKFQYFILTDRKSVHPYEARFYKRRNLNIGVGKRESFGLGSEMGGARSRAHWLTGEVHILEGLNDLINVARDDFAFSQYYEELKNFLRKQLSHHSNNLEEEAEYEREKHDQKIKNIAFLEPEETPKEKDKSGAQSSLEDVGLASSPKEKPVTISRSVQKKIDIKGISYIAKSGEWNYQKEFFPACKIEGNTVIINKSYPLFYGIKHTDVFVKLHLLLLTNYLEGVLNDDGYTKIMAEVLEFYQDYI